LTKKSVWSYLISVGHQTDINRLTTQSRSSLWVLGTRECVLLENSDVDPHRGSRILPLCMAF